MPLLKWSLLLPILGALCALSCTAEMPDSYYTAGVVEYTPTVARSMNVTTAQARAIMLANVAQYEKFMIEAKAQGVDILVFPEYGLYGPSFATRDAVLPYLESIPNAGANPCTEHEIYPYLNITTRLSCLALKYQLNVAVDMGDLQPCSRWDYDCPKDRRYQFNTAVVFGTDGAIVAKYHKTNLYFEPEFDVPINQHPIEFELFGVKFGVLICFDIMFAKPQIEMLQRYGVTDVIYPTWWVNTPPILTAVQIQQGWSRAFGLNLLASNSGWNRKTSGSGVFSNGIALSSFTNPTLSSQNHLLVHRIPKLAPRAADPNTPKLPNSVRIPTEELEKSDKPLLLSTKVLRTWDVSSAVTESVQIEGIQCTLTYQVAPTSTQPSSPNFTNSTFVLYAAKGYLTPLFPATACGVATCHTEKPSDCITLMQRPQQSLEANSTLFNFFSIKAIYSNTTNLTVYPVSAKHDSVLFSEDELTYIKTSAAVHTLTTPSQLFKSGSSVTVLHAGFLGRDLNTFM